MNDLRQTDLDKSLESLLSEHRAKKEENTTTKSDPRFESDFINDKTSTVDDFIKGTKKRLDTAATYLSDEYDKVTLKDTGVQVLGAFTDTVEGAVNTIADGINFTESLFTDGEGLLPDDWKLSFSEGIFPESNNIYGRLVRGVVPYLTTFAAAGKLINAGGKITRFSKQLAASSVMTSVIEDPDEQNLSAMLREIPELKPYVIDMLATDPNDSRLMNRARNAVESVIFDMALAGGIGAPGAARKFAKTVAKNIEARKVAKNVVSQKQAVDELVSEAEAKALKAEAVSDPVVEVNAEFQPKTTGTQKVTREDVTKRTEKITSERVLKADDLPPELVKKMESFKGRVASLYKPGDLPVELIAKIGRAKTPEQFDEIFKSVKGDDILETQKLGYRSVEESFKEGEKYLAKPGSAIDLLTRTPNEPINDVNHAAISIIYEDSTDDLKRAARSILKNSDSVAEAEFDALFTKAMYLGALKGGSLETAARTLNLGQYIPKNYLEGKDTKLVLDYLTQTGNSNKDRENLARAIVNLSDAVEKKVGKKGRKAVEGSVKLKAFTEMGTMEKASRYIRTYTYNNLLSNPLTPVYVATSQLYIGLSELVEQGIIKPGLDKLFYEGKYGGESRAFLRGLFEQNAWRQAGGKLKDFWLNNTVDKRHGKLVDDKSIKLFPMLAGKLFPMSSVNTPGEASIFNVIGHAINPMSWLNTLDIPGEIVFDNAFLNLAAYRKAKQLVMDAGLPDGDIDGVYKTLLRNPDKDIMNSVQNATDLVLMKANTSTLPIVGAGASGLTKFITHTPGVKQLNSLTGTDRWLRVMSNTYEWSLQRNPYSLFTLGDLTQAERLDRQSKVVSGVSQLLGWGYLSSELVGFIDFKGEPEESEKNIKRALFGSAWEGTNTLKIKLPGGGEALLPLGRLLGPGVVFAQVGYDIQNLLRYASEEDMPEVEKFMAAVGESVMSVLIPGDLLQSTSLLSDLVSGRKDYLNSITDFISSAYVPGSGFQSFLESNFGDNTRRATDFSKAYDNIKAKFQDRMKITGWDDNLPPRRNMFGDIIKLKGDMTIGMADPFFSGKIEKKDVVLYQALYDLGFHSPLNIDEMPSGESKFSMSMPSKTINVGSGFGAPGIITKAEGFTVELEPDDYDNLVRFSAGIFTESEIKEFNLRDTQSLKDRLKEVVTGKVEVSRGTVFNDLSRELKKAVLADEIRAYQNRGRQLFRMSLENFQDELINMGILRENTLLDEGSGTESIEGTRSAPSTDALLRMLGN